MKNIIILFAVVILTLGCKKESITATDESKHIILHGSIGVHDGSTILSASGDIVTVGTKGVGNKNRMLLYKTTPEGEMIFASVFHEEKSRATSVYEDAQENLYVVGRTHGENPLYDRAFAAAKLNRDGEVIWEKTYHPQKNIIAYQVVGVNNNEIIISGERDSAVVFLKINSLGEELQFQVTENTNYGFPASMLLLQNGQILITGTTADSAIRLSCYDTAFNLLWEETYGSGRSGISTIQLDDGDLITVGKATHMMADSNVIDYQKVIILKTTSNGELIWEKEVGDIEYKNFGTDIAENEDGSFVITGYGPDNPSGSTFSLLLRSEHMLIHVDAAGNEIHSKYYSEKMPSSGLNILKVAGDRNVVTGGCQDGIFFLNVNNKGF